MYLPELLSPVGDFECLKAAVQNGADSVYLGASMFSARASANNFDLKELEQAVKYAKLRGVKVHLALNTLIKNDEFASAIQLAKSAYEIGVDAIIVQDFGLAITLIDLFPDLPIHASTQMTVHNLDSVNALQNLGFKRVVLSRELSINEIENICKNSNCEIEAFVHGALCVSYSGQCLFSSMIGGRSGNRGKCAQPCRLPYELINDNQQLIDKGYLLSPKDLFALDFLPQLINAKVDCFKIEGRMKTPEYVATVTRIYRKYLDMALNNKDYAILEQDKYDLLQVFNRGGFSSGHLENTPNKIFVFKDKPNNMGIYLGEVSNFDAKKGYVNLKLESTISVGDKICIDYDGVSNNYHVSELMLNHNNKADANIGDFVTIGRMKGNIKRGNKIYKLESKNLIQTSNSSYSNIENKRISLFGHICIKKGIPVTLSISTKESSNHIANNINLSFASNIIPTDAINSPITEERVHNQLCKTKNTIFNFDKITVDLDDNLYISNISELNQLRRDALDAVENTMLLRIKRTCVKPYKVASEENFHANLAIDGVSLFLNTLHLDFNYTELCSINRLYIPLKFFLDNNYSQILQDLSKTFSIYIAMPVITRKNYSKLMDFSSILDIFNIKGFLVSQLGQIELLRKYNLELVANSSFNIYNFITVDKLKKLGVSNFTISPELDKKNILDLSKLNGSELIVYGATPVMHTNYCVLGSSNHCYSGCKRLCTSSSAFYLKDRLGFKFRVIPDNIDTVSTLYNSKITSISYTEFLPNSVRIDILDENINEINSIISTVISGKRCEGKEFTNANLNREL